MRKEGEEGVEGEGREGGGGFSKGRRDETQNITIKHPITLFNPNSFPTVSVHAKPALFNQNRYTTTILLQITQSRK